MNKKKIPLRVYLFFALAAVFLFFGVLFFYKLYQNHAYVTAYASGDYLTDKEEKLLFVNIPESYLPYYNLGNASYKETDYTSAVGYYTKALSMLPIGQKECAIRINLALAMCNTIDFEHIDSQQKLDMALITLYKARDVLLENGWANDDPSLAKDEEAQQLKEDIDDMIKRLENPDGGTNNQNDSNEPNPDEEGEGEQTSPTEREKRQKDQLEGNKKDAMEERRQQQGTMDNEGDGAGGGSYNPW